MPPDDIEYFVEKAAALRQLAEEDEAENGLLEEIDELEDLLERIGGHFLTRKIGCLQARRDVNQADLSLQ